MMHFKGGPLDGVANELGDPENLTAEWNHERNVYDVRDEDGGHHGYIATEVTGFHKKTPRRELVRGRHFWSFVLIGMSIAAQLPLAFINDLQIRASVYAVAWGLMLVAWWLK